MDYQKLTEELKKVPLTWYPELIRVLVEAAIARGCFLPGGATRWVKAVEDAQPTPAINQAR